MWKRDSALRVSLTNLELLKSLPRRRRVNFGKTRTFLKKKRKKKSNPLPHRKKFHDFYFKEKKVPNYYYILALFVILPNSTLGVFNKKQHPTNNKRINKHTKKPQKTTFYLIHSLFFWTLYNNSVFTISYFTSVLHYSLLYS